jgi:hypothetical protein
MTGLPGKMIAAVSGVAVIADSASLTVVTVVA